MTQHCNLPTHLADALRQAADALESARDPQALERAIRATDSAWDVVSCAKTSGCQRLVERRTRLAALAAHVLDGISTSGRIAPDDAHLESFIIMSRDLADILVDPALANICPFLEHPKGSDACTASALRTRPTDSDTP